MRPRAVSVAGWLLVIMGVAELAVYLLLRIAQAMSPAVADVLRAYSASGMSYAMAGVNGLAYAVFGLGLLKRQSWSFWCFVAYVPLVQLLAGTSRGRALSAGTVIELCIYAFLVVLLLLPTSRSYLQLQRQRAA